MNAQPKIIVLITYFGNFPWYFSYFLHSCKFNSTIDFVIFTNNDSKHLLPRNVKFIRTTLEEIKNLANKKLQIKASIDYPYKLCDFKPAYGLIFEDFTKGYDFWAQSDIDLIYGNLRSMINYEILSRNDFVSVRHDYTTGCFTLSRNNVLMNNLFKRSKDYEKVFTSEPYWGFDELNFKHCEINEGKTLATVETEIECFTHVVKNASDRNEIRAFFDFLLVDGVPGQIKFDNGQLIYGRKYEVALYHLYWLKKVYNPKTTPLRIPDIFYISPSKIYSKNDKSES